MKQTKNKIINSISINITLLIIVLFGISVLPSIGFEEEQEKKLAISYQTKEIYNGNMKKNQIKGTKDVTTYQETEEIVIGKEEIRKKLRNIRKSYIC